MIFHPLRRNAEFFHRLSFPPHRLDVTLPRAYVDGTPLPQLTLVAKYRTGIDVGRITVSTGTPRGGFVNGWVPETLADLVATCLPPGPSVNCGYR